MGCLVFEKLYFGSWCFCFCFSRCASPTRPDWDFSFGLNGGGVIEVWYFWIEAGYKGA